MNVSKKILLLSFLFSGALSSEAQDLAPLQEDISRPWIGPEYFTNPLMNWRLSDGRMETTHGGWVNEAIGLNDDTRRFSGTSVARLGLNVTLDGRFEVEGGDE